MKLQTDHQLITALLCAADIVGRQSREPVRNRSQETRRERDVLAGAIVERLNGRDERIKLLQAMVAGLRRELALRSGLEAQ